MSMVSLSWGNIEDQRRIEIFGKFFVRSLNSQVHFIPKRVTVKFGVYVIRVVYTSYKKKHPPYFTHGTLSWHRCSTVTKLNESKMLTEIKVFVLLMISWT